jgi:hypothetical protein
MGRIVLKKKSWHLRRLDIDTPAYVFKSFPVIVGRGSQCDVILDDPSVADVHAQFNQTEDGLFLYDLGGAEGVFVAGHRVTSIPILSGQDVSLEIKFGSVKCILCFGMPPAHKPAPPKDPEAIWFFASNGETHGPLTPAQMFQAVDSGRLCPADEVWRDDMDYRVQAAKVKGLFGAETASAPENVPVAEAPVASMANPGHGSVSCPYCWYHFNPEDVLFIASHPELLGDAVLGVEEPQRFLPTRFTPEGLALDAKGMRCPDIACPRCHIRLPALAVSAPPVFLSIVGAPASGKSYYLASSMWKLRTVLPGLFGCSFADADAVTNQWLNDYEERLFFQSESARIQPIVKTDETAAHVYRAVTLDDMQVFLPLPCMFSFTSGLGAADKRCLVLYDNAGEHFQAGHDSIYRPGTQHLLHSEGILFLFDPLADPRFRRFLRDSMSSSLGTAAVHRQDVLLVEMISRIRKHLGLTGGELYEKPLVLGISKADVFGDLLRQEDDPWIHDPTTGGHALDLGRIAEVSYRTRRLLMQYAPEIVNTVEGFARRVVYVPVSALGHNPPPEGVQPSLIQPRWVEVPLLYILAKSGYLPVAGLPDDSSGVRAQVEQRGYLLRFHAPETGAVHEVPWHYCGYELECHQSGRRFRVPHVDGAPVI